MITKEPQVNSKQTIESISAINHEILTPSRDQLDLTIARDQDSSLELGFPKFRLLAGLTITIIGYLLFLLGARPGLFGLDRSRVIGFVQIAVFLFGLAIITIGSYVALISFWPRGSTSLLADFGTRFISTGYVICVFMGLADIFGFGSHPLPNVFFGPLQAHGVEFGMLIIAAGLLMLVRQNRK